MPCIRRLFADAASPAAGTGERPFLRAGSVRFFGFSDRYEVLLKGQPPAERIFMLQPADHSGFVGLALAEGPRFLRRFPAKSVQHEDGLGVDARGYLSA